MKIVVLGTMIEVDNIYSISELSDGFSNIHFTITSFNNNELRVEIRTNCEMYMTQTKVRINGCEEWIDCHKKDDGKYRDLHECCELAEKTIHESKSYRDALDKIKRVRDVVIAYWSNNQCNIPKVDFE